MKIYRMHRAARAAADYSGAMLAGGRWNPIGTPMLYTAQHLSLACLEILVHLDKSELPRDYVWSWTDLPRNPERLEFDDLNHVSSCQAAGAPGCVRRENSRYRYRRLSSRPSRISC